MKLILPTSGAHDDALLADDFGTQRLDLRPVAARHQTPRGYLAPNTLALFG